MPTRRSFRNAIINLVVNARDAMPGGGTVTIRTANETVSDASRAGHRHHAGGRLCPHRGGRHRHRHVQGDPEQDLRSLLHHQAGGPGHGPGARHRLWHRQADRRLHHRGQRSGQGHQLPHLSAAPRRSKPAMPRRRTPRRSAARRHRPGHDPAGRGRGSGAQLRGAGAAHARLQCAGGQRRRRGAGDRQGATAPRSICSSPTW